MVEDVPGTQQDDNEDQIGEDENSTNEQISDVSHDQPAFNDQVVSVFFLIVIKGQANLTQKKKFN